MIIINILSIPDWHYSIIRCIFCSIYCKSFKLQVKIQSHPIRMQDSLIINISQSNQWRSYIFCREIVFKERKPLRLLLLVGFHQHFLPSLNLLRSAMGALDHLRCTTTLNLGKMKDFVIINIQGSGKIFTPYSMHINSSYRSKCFPPIRSEFFLTTNTPWSNWLIS